MTRTVAASGRNVRSAASIVQARYRVSPAPIRIPSSTYSKAPTGWLAATTTTSDQTRSRTSGSVVKIGMYAGRSARTRTAMASPLPSPQASARRLNALAVAGSEAPSA